MLGAQVSNVRPRCREWAQHAAFQTGTLLSRSRKALDPCTVLEPRAPSEVSTLASFLSKPPGSRGRSSPERGAKRCAVPDLSFLPFPSRSPASRKDTSVLFFPLYRNRVGKIGSAQEPTVQ